LPIRCSIASEAGQPEIGALQPQQRAEYQTGQQCRDAAAEHCGQRLRTGKQDQHREAVCARAEEAHVAERQVAGEPVDQVQPLRQHQEHDDVQQQQAVVIQGRQHC